MVLRYIKIMLAGFIALLGIFYAAENLHNLPAAFNTVSAVLSMQGHDYYPNAIGPAIHAPWLAWTAVAVIISGELGGGVIAAKGAWDMWRTRAVSDFNDAKHMLYVGSGVLLIVWFGFFTVIGGAYFAMWQTELGAMSLEGAFQFLGSVALVTLFISATD